jgi:hypothetical protein
MSHRRWYLFSHIGKSELLWRSRWLVGVLGVGNSKSAVFYGKVLVHFEDGQTQ